LPENTPQWPTPAGVTSDSQAVPARRRADVSPQRQPEVVRAALPREVAAAEAVDAPRPVAAVVPPAQRVAAAERPAQRVVVVAARPAQRVAAAVRRARQVAAAERHAQQVAAAERRVPRAEAAEQDALRPAAAVHARRPAVRASRSRERAKLWRTAAARRVPPSRPELAFEAAASSMPQVVGAP
jgi:hypothetical protein